MIELSEDLDPINRGVEMPYLGTLSASSSYTLECVSTANVAVTVVNIRRDRITEIESLVFPPGLPPGAPRTVASNVGRLVFLTSAEVNATGLIRITQGTNQWEVTFAPDASITFDIS